MSARVEVAVQNMVGASDQYKNPGGIIIIKGVTTMQVLKFVPTCSVVGNDSYDFFRELEIASLKKESPGSKQTASTRVYSRLLACTPHFQHRLSDNFLLSWPPSKHHAGGTEGNVRGRRILCQIYLDCESYRTIWKGCNCKNDKILL
jgi:hypothetical protein